MPITLYLRLPADPTATTSWLALEPGTIARSGSSLPAAAGLGAQRVIALVPGSEVLLTHADLPATSRQRMLQAVPYVLEEQLADEVEALHFAVGRRNSDGQVPVAVVASAYMERWLEQLTAAGLAPHLLLPDILALPWEPDSWTLLLEEEAAILRTGEAQGYAFEPDLLAAALPHALAREERPRQMVVHDCRPAAPPDPSLELACGAAEVGLVRRDCRLGAFQLLASGPIEGAIDLLQGPFSRREQAGKRWRPWIPTAALLAALLLLEGGMLFSEYLQLARTDQQLTERIEAVYREAFPDSKRIVDARVQMEQQLTLLRGGAGQQEFADLLTRAAPILAATQGLELQALRYREGELELEIRLAELAGLDRLKAALGGEAGLSAEIQNANAADSTVEARLVLRRSGRS